MAQFVALETGIEVSGAAILSTIAGMMDDIAPVLARYGIFDVSADEWYPQQAWLDVLRDIASGKGFTTLDLVSIGMQIPDNALWPPEVQSAQDALFSIDVAYHMNHRGGEIGNYAAERVGYNHIRVSCDNPYPSDFDYGIIYRTTQKFLPRGTAFKVVRAAAPSRINGDDTCIYDVTWE